MWPQQNSKLALSKDGSSSQTEVVNSVRGTHVAAKIRVFVVASSGIHLAKRLHSYQQQT